MRGFAELREELFWFGDMSATCVESQEIMGKGFWFDNVAGGAVQACADPLALI